MEEGEGGMKFSIGQGRSHKNTVTLLLDKYDLQFLRKW